MKKLLLVLYNALFLLHAVCYMLHKVLYSVHYYTICILHGILNGR